MPIDFRVKNRRKALDAVRAAAEPQGPQLPLPAGEFFVPTRPLFAQMTPEEQAIIDGAPGPDTEAMLERIGIMMQPPIDDLDAAVAQQQRIGVAVNPAGQLMRNEGGPNMPLLRTDRPYPMPAQELAMGNPWEVTPEMEARQAAAVEAAGISPNSATYDTKMGPKLEQIGVQRLKDNEVFQDARAKRIGIQQTRQAEVNRQAAQREKMRTPVGRFEALMDAIGMPPGGDAPAGGMNRAAFGGGMLFGPVGFKAMVEAGASAGRDKALVDVARFNAGGTSDLETDRRRLRIKITNDNPTWAPADVEAELDRQLGTATPQPGGTPTLPPPAAPLPRPQGFGTEAGTIKDLATWQKFLQSKDPAWLAQNAALLREYEARIRQGMSTADLDASLGGGTELPNYFGTPNADINARNSALRGIFGLPPLERLPVRPPWQTMPDPSIIPRQKFMP